MTAHDKSEHRTDQGARRETRRAVLFFLAAGILPTGLDAQLPAQKIERMEALLRPVVGKNKTVGMAVGVRLGEDRWTAGYGHTAKPDGRVPDASTLFEVGSITKVFTGILLADCAQRGLVAIDDPVAKFLPDGVQMPQSPGRAITLVDLSTHRSGLPRLPNNARPKDGKDPYADYDTELLYEFLDDYRLRRAPGERYEYSNLAVGLLGHTLGLVVDKPYDVALRERVLLPLGMKSTRVQITGRELPNRDRVAAVHDGIGRPARHWFFDALAGCGAVRSSVDDMLAFVDANLDVGEIGDDAPRLRRALATARRPHADNGRRTGLGWHFRGDRVTCLWHNGGTGGSRSFLALDVESKLGVVLLTNSARSVDDVGWKLFDLLRE